MIVSINKPELLNITDSLEHKTYFGANQVWYTKTWNREAGCGPTCASNITAYLAQTREKYKELFIPNSLEKKEFLKHMNELFKYVTPGAMGVNHVDKFVSGITQFAKDRGVLIETEVFSVENCFTKKRNAEKLTEFVCRGLTADCPLAFLNLSRGEETSLQAWHWITITSAEIKEGSLIATASDEGRAIQFDLLKWYLTTRMHGGLIFIK
ncbi:hypothetical protein Ana3638_13760 [Anaerocolumna sedimenticola]|uniref:Peptidase C39-like domain-containing protein n=1 Tax=Anaerocolumna sedimenticola TaxID=2696063 RepID=A0A6P1TN01_9FIRM|nr:hypothetical protein [Anaerocolumna sedimenticola]QHQ61707.1 hypothetical protein Ana3638_13760 [Anaerocolumna sedimenticola]